MKVALFLGAGASVFAGQPATAKLMEILRERIRDDGAEIGEITKTIVNSTDYTDIEQLYDGIDRMLDMRDAKHDTHNIKPIIRALHDSGGEFKTALDELERLKSVINGILHEKLVVDAGARGSIADVYDMVRSVIKDHVADGFWVFTTNYDMVVEAYAKEIHRELVNGFQQRQSNDDVWVNEWDGQTKNPVYLVKLHGSVNWYREGKRILADKDGGKGTTDNSVLIAPTEGPKDYGEPFRELKERFEEEMKDVDTLLVIGFSYRDEEIVKIIRNRLKEGMALISVSPNTLEDIRHVSNDAGFIMPLGVGKHHTLPIVGCKGIRMINQKFELDTIADMRVRLNECFGFARDYVEHTRLKSNDM